MDPHAVCALHRDKHYDLILLDLLMPKMDGFEVMEELKKLKIDDYLPVLVLTAQPSHKLRALQAGAKDFISQPFNLIEVKTRIRNMLEVRLLYKKAKHYGLEMRSLALHDGLTGLPNRQLFMDRLSLAIANAHRYKRNMTCIWI
jgi:PleD family two-component response regulator